MFRGVVGSSKILTSDGYKSLRTLEKDDVLINPLGDATTLKTDLIEEDMSEFMVFVVNDIRMIVDTRKQVLVKCDGKLSFIDIQNLEAGMGICLYNRSLSDTVLTESECIMLGEFLASIDVRYLTDDLRDMLFFYSDDLYVSALSLISNLDLKSRSLVWDVFDLLLSKYSDSYAVPRYATSLNMFEINHYRNILDLVYSSHTYGVDYDVQLASKHSYITTILENDPAFDSTSRARNVYLHSVYERSKLQVEFIDDFVVLPVKEVSIVNKKLEGYSYELDGPYIYNGFVFREKC